MSTKTFRICLTLLGCVILGVLAVMVGRTFLADHDGWSIIREVNVDAEPLIIEPANLLSEDDEDSIRKVVDEARFYGIPWSIMVVSDETVSATTTTEVLAQAALEDFDIESSPSADDGLLMYVLIPADDHTQTRVAFATGENFYPKGGITPEWLQWIVDVQMAPIIEADAIGDAVIEGATWVEWTQLFRPAPDPPATNLESGLHSLLHPLGTLALALLALLVAGCAIVVMRLTRRGHEPQMPAAQPSLDPVQAATLLAGRVDHRSFAGVVLDALDRGVLERRGNEITTASSPASDTSWCDPLVVQTVARLEASGIPVTPARLARALRLSPLRQQIEDTLAAAGYLDSRSYRFQLALRIASLTGAIIGAGALVLSVAGEVAPTLLAAVALTVVAVVVLIWNENRSWTTESGHIATSDWLARHHEPDDRQHALLDVVYHLDDVNAAKQSGVASSLRYQG